MFSRPWLTLLRRQVLIHRRALAFCLTVAAVLLGWSAFVSRPPATVAPPGVPAVTAPATVSPQPGHVRLPVRFADGEMAGLLHPGQRIQLWATDARTQRARVIARDTQVVEVVSQPPSGAAYARQSRLVVVSVRVTEVETVARFNSNGVLTFVLDQ
ncbi:MAG TPA: hypothetical protein VFA96_02760 [Nocardioides sp.]|nr:hypothetical protein [Nocardioides sp.]